MSENYQISDNSKPFHKCFGGNSHLRLEEFDKIETEAQESNIELDTTMIKAITDNLTISIDTLQ